MRSFLNESSYINEMLYLENKADKTKTDAVRKTSKHLWSEVKDSIYTEDLSFPIIVKK